MRIIKSVPALRKVISEARRKGKSIGLVPTMGYLHEGHASLLRQCCKDNDISVLSIFVNPKQFGPNEDFTKYPRDLKKDEKLAKKENVDIIFYPSADEVYPTGYLTYVEVEGLSGVLCGESRPGHFKGVTTVVAKLINMVQPDVMYLGQKDAQQALIIRKMADDLNFPLKIKVMPTVREHDGLAMSSRNVYLTPEERGQAVTLYRALQEAKNRILSGQRDASRITEDMAALIKEKTDGSIDYIECVDINTLKNVEKISGRVLIALAVKFGKARLIDNVLVDTK
jgi:pantoate--beta-alanine ligase